MSRHALLYIVDKLKMHLGSRACHMWARLDVADYLRNYTSLKLTEDIYFKCTSMHVTLVLKNNIAETKEDHTKCLKCKHFKC